MIVATAEPGVNAPSAPRGADRAHLKHDAGTTDE